MLSGRSPPPLWGCCPATAIPLSSPGEVVSGGGQVCALVPDVFGWSPPLRGRRPLWLGGAYFNVSCKLKPKEFGAYLDILPLLWVFGGYFDLFQFLPLFRGLNGYLNFSPCYGFLVVIWISSPLFWGLGGCLFFFPFFVDFSG